MIVMVSGGFDPLHKGHIRLINAASVYGRVVVALNSDSWLTMKKGRPFMEWSERAEILHALKQVSEVIPVDDADGTVCEALRALKPDSFANGGDRNEANPAESEWCRKLGITQLFGVGGGKVQSSSKLCATR